VKVFQRSASSASNLILPPIEPAKDKFYSSLTDLSSELDQYFEVEDRFHLGAYDYLTRVFYPLVVGSENAKHEFCL